MVPGLFQNISRGQRTTYTEDIVDEEMQNVFMHESENGRVIVARTAIPADDADGGRFVLFSEGSVSENAESGYQLTQFGELGVRIPARDISIDVALEERAMSTTALWQSDETAHAAELQWRISLVLLIPVLTLMAVPLSKVSPRQGRFAKMVPAVFLYIIYFGLLLVSRDLTAAGTSPVMLGMWWVHGLFLVLGWLLFTSRMPSLALPRFLTR
jgi:lipopolysaccharide export system permease protein